MPQSKSNFFWLDDRGIGGTHMIQQQFVDMHRKVHHARKHVDDNPPSASMFKRPHFGKFGVDFRERIKEKRLPVASRVDSSPPASYHLISDLFITRPQRSRYSSAGRQPRPPSASTTPRQKPAAAGSAASGATVVLSDSEPAVAVGTGTLQRPQSARRPRPPSAKASRDPARPNQFCGSDEAVTSDSEPSPYASSNTGAGRRPQSARVARDVIASTADDRTPSLRAYSESIAARLADITAQKAKLRSRRRARLADDEALRAAARAADTNVDEEDLRDAATNVLKHMRFHSFDNGADAAAAAAASARGVDVVDDKGVLRDEEPVHGFTLSPSAAAVAAAGGRPTGFGQTYPAAKPAGAAAASHAPDVLETGHAAAAAHAFPVPPPPARGTRAVPSPSKLRRSPVPGDADAANTTTPPTTPPRAALPTRYAQLDLPSTTKKDRAQSQPDADDEPSQPPPLAWIQGYDDDEDLR